MTADAAWAGPVPDGPADPGPPTAVALGVWPDGTPLPALLSLDGVFVSTDFHVPAAGSWHRLAGPRAPLTRDLAVAVAPDPEPGADRDEGRLAWTDGQGIRTVAVSRRRTRPRPGTGAGPGFGPIAVTAPAPVPSQSTLLVPVLGGGEPRFPLAAVSAGSGLLDVLWTTDRRTLLHSAARSRFPADPAVEVPVGLTGPERLRALGAVAESPRTAWLACLTDQGRVLAAGWDLAFGEFGRWAELPAPVPDLVAIAAVCVSSAPVLLAATGQGHLIGTDLRSAARGDGDWSSVTMPGGWRPGPLRALAAASGGGRTWIAVLCDDGAWLVPLGMRGDYLSCGPAFALRVGD